MTLQVISQQARALGAAATYQFDPSGGTIGRIDGNNWILPDADRFVSSQHARVSFESGGWYLTDISTNGTYVNDPGFLIGNGHTVPLNDGDRLYVGDYEIAVSIGSAVATGPNPGASMTGPAANPYNTGGQSNPVGGAPDADPFGDMAGSNPFGDSPQPNPFMTGPQRTGPATGPSFTDPMQGAVSDPSIPGAGQSLDPLDLLMGSGPDPFAAPSPAPEAGGKPADPELDPLAAFATPDIIEEVPEEPMWPSEAGAAQDHASPLNQQFSAPRADSGLIPDDWTDETVMPGAQAPAPAPPPRAAAPVPASPQAPPTGNPQVARGTPPPQAAPQQAAQVPPHAPMPSSEASGVFAQPQAAQVPPAPEYTMEQPALAVGAGSAEGLRRLLDAAGVDPARMPPQAANAVFQLAGGVFREVVQGLMEVLRARDELKSELRIARTVIQSARNNPLKFSVSTDEALTKLLFPQEHGYMAPVEALREAIDDIKAHQIAMMAGLSAALSSIMEQFDPEELESRFQKTLKHSPMAAFRGKAKYWEMYEEYYQQLAGDSASSILALYGEDFAQAYQDQIDKLS